MSFLSPLQISSDNYFLFSGCGPRVDVWHIQKRDHDAPEASGHMGFVTAIALSSDDKVGSEGLFLQNTFFRRRAILRWIGEDRFRLKKKWVPRSATGICHRLRHDADRCAGNLASKSSTVSRRTAEQQLLTEWNMAFSKVFYLLPL